MAVTPPSVPQLVLLFFQVLCLGLLLLQQSAGQPAVATTIRELYVKPADGASCPTLDKPCYTLNEYVLNATQYIVSNTRMNFLAGSHSLNHTLTIEHVANLTLVATSDDVVVSCYGTEGGVSVVKAFNLTLSELTFTSCSFSLSDVDDPLLSVSSATLVHIKNCDFIQYGLGFYLVSSDSEIVIENTRITQLVVNHFPNAIEGCNGGIIVFRNVSFVYSAIYGDDGSIWSWLALPQAVITVYNASNINFVSCSFTGHATDAFPVLPVGSFVMLVKAHNVTFTNCIFYDSGITPLSAYDSTFLFEGTNKFTNNSAYRGGALALFGSYIEVVPSSGSNVIFQNNVAADVGGAIYIKTNYIFRSKCFLKFDLAKAGNCSSGDCSCLLNSFNATFSFINNTAQSGGNSIYGASFDECLVSDEPWCDGTDLVWFLGLDPGRNTSDFSSVASDPLRACVCVDEKPDCTDSVITPNPPQFPSSKVYSGLSFQLPVAIVGDRFGTVAGSVHAQLLPVAKGYLAKSELGELQQMQQVGHQCTNLTYTISSSYYEATLVLTANAAAVKTYPNQAELSELWNEKSWPITWGIGDLLRTFPVFITVNINSCPSGFVQSKETLQCICDPRLQKYDIGCNLATLNFQRSGTVWLSTYYQYDVLSGLSVNGHCPHCKPEQLDITSGNADIQCSLNHSGTICGGCQAGLSLALGSDQCLSCSNEYLILLIPFALAGFALVFFLKLLNLTVAQGTLNGLIFYANIVKANREAWLPAMSPNFLTIFISWLNLDLGIETCFFHGLDAYKKVWLQFVFPTYIWVIMLMIIVLSHYSQSLARIIGGNSVPVLATLFLLSYAKLLHTIISLFQVSPVYSLSASLEGGVTQHFWSYDGTIRYHRNKLVPLFFVASLFLVLFCVPYTTTLLFGQCFQKIAHHRFTNRIMNTLKPFFDAYYGPFKDKHRYWVGLMLLTRVVLFTVFSATPTDMSNVDLLATAAIVFSLLIHLNAGWVYRKNYLNILDNSFLLNLGVFAVGTLYISASGTGNQTTLANLLLGIAFVQFIAVVVLHAYTSLRETKLARRLLPARFQQQQVQIDRAQYERIPPEPDARDGVRPLVMSYNDYREPVLKYQDT